MSYHVLRGKMVLNSQIGRHILSMGWPLMLLLIVFCMFSQFSPLGFGCHALGREEAFATMDGAKVVIVRGNVPHLLFVALCGSALLLLILHQVHASLLRLTLKTFDFTVIMLSCMRLWASFAYSRFMIVGDYSVLPEDFLILYIVLITACTVIVMESADMSPRTKYATAVLLMAWSYMVWLQGLVDSSNWDRDAEMSFVWLAPMTPRNQYISSSLVVAISLTKACFRLSMGNDFMFVTAEYTVQRDSVDRFLKDLGLKADLTLEDWCELLGKAGIHGPLGEASYAALACRQSGILLESAVRRALVELFLKHPSLPPRHLLRLLCEMSVEEASGIGPIPKMLNTVLRQWQSIRTQELGKSIYHRLVKTPSIAALFSGANVHAHISTFVGILSVAMGWLRESDFCKVAREVEEIGGRHVAYGVQAASLPLFMSALLEGLEEQLGEGIAGTKYAWTLVWTQLIITPFMRGLARSAWMSRRRAQTLVDVSFQALKEMEGFSDKLCFCLREHCPSVFDKIVEPQGDDPAGDCFAFVSSLVRIFTTKRRSSDGEGEALDRSWTSHWPQLRAVHLMDLLDLQRALLAAVQDTLDVSGESSKNVSTAWAYILHFELVEQHLATHFAHSQLPPECSAIEGGVSLETFGKLFQNYGLSEELLENTHRSLASSPDGAVNMASFRAAVINQSLMQPFSTLEEILREIVLIQKHKSPKQRRLARANTVSLV